jgi:hypothetical protein
MLRGVPANAIEKPVLRGATIYMTTVSTVITAGNDIVWEALDFDTDNISNIDGANPERLTIPIWAKYAKLVFSAPSVGTAPVYELYKNNSQLKPAPGGVLYSQGGTNEFWGRSTPWITVSSGNYFTVRLVSGAGVSIVDDAWFGIELRG